MVNIRKPKFALKFNRPAEWWGSTWREALPTGNGIIGAAVYGGAANDTVMINHRDLWWQGHVGVLKDVADKINEVRKKMDDNKPLMAENILSNALVSSNYRPQQAYPLPLCDFKIDMPIDKSVKEYQRIINMENGEVTVTYKDGTTRYERSCFVSRAKDIVCYEISRAGAKTINATFSLDMHDKFNARTQNAISKLPEGVTVKYESFFMYFSARSDNGTEFGCTARISHFGGTQTVDPTKGITIRGAEKILVLIKPFIESQREKEWKNGKSTLTAEKLTYDKLIKEHTQIHSKLFSSAELGFDADDRDAAIDQLLDEAFSKGLPPALAEKLWAYGRYLLICGSSSTTQPCPPYGLWCGDFKAVSSHISAAGGMQSMYAQAFAGNLGDYITSIYNYYANQMDDLKKNSSRLFGCRGIMIPSVIAHSTGALGSVEPSVIHFVAATGWVCQLFYDYYRFSCDEKFLKTKAMPLMKEAATFYGEFLKVKDGVYESCPSYSPSSTPGNYAINANGLAIAKNSLVDFAAVRELLTNLIKGSAITGLYKEEVKTWEYMLTVIPAYMQNTDGTIKEYSCSEYTDNDLAPSPLSFYPVYPGTELCGQADEVLKPFDLTAKKKYESAKRSHTAATIAWYANVFARLGQGNESYSAIADLVKSMSMKNLILATNDWRGMGIGITDLWAAYSLEANMSVTNAIQEMLIQSTDDTIFLLPALPTELKSGELIGFQTRMGVEVSAVWNGKKNTLNVKLKSRKARTVSLKLPTGASYRLPKNAVEVFDAEKATLSNVSLPAGKQLSFDFKL